MKKKFGKKCNYMYNFFRYRYVKSDLTQSGMLTVALLFFSAKLSSFPRVERKKQRSKPAQKCDFLNLNCENLYKTCLEETQLVWNFFN